MDKKLLPVGTAVIAGLFILVIAATYFSIKPSPPPDELMGVLRPQFRQITAFQVTDQHGELLSEAAFRGKWSFVFFGYMSCPDVCPATLDVLNSVNWLMRDENGGKLDDEQFIFVSVDPERDTTKQLGTYVRYFNKDLIGATGDKSQIDDLTRQFGAGYQFAAETSPGQYLVAHTSAIFLVDPLGRVVANFSQPHYASTIFRQYMKIKAYFSGIG